MTTLFKFPKKCLDPTYRDIKYTNNLKYLGENISQNTSDKESFKIRKLKLANALTSTRGLYSSLVMFVTLVLQDSKLSTLCSTSGFLFKSKSVLKNCFNFTIARFHIHRHYHNNCTPSDKTNTMSIHSVSYTHLDVYKRQEH